jgi:hypothetical protein
VQQVAAARSQYFAVVLPYDCQFKKEKMERELRARSVHGVHVPSHHYGCGWR